MLLIARSRLHVSLADMGRASARAFGGVGISINEPTTVLELEEARQIEVHGLESLDEEARIDTAAIIARLQPVLGGRGFKAVLRSAPPQHVGFGSKTSLSLGLV